MIRKYLFETSVKIREFECDMQGVVNNAYYHNLLEQTRAEFFESVGIDVKEWSMQLGIDFVVYQASILYRSPIVPGETVRSCLNMHREGARFVFNQDFRREGNGELCIKARVDIVVGMNGKLTKGDYLADHLAGKIYFPVSSRLSSISTNNMNGHLDDILFNYEMKVHDYECNRYGSATNTFVQHYLEITRLEFMESVGESFRQWHQNGVDMMVSRMDLKFIRPMMSSEKFSSVMNVRHDGPRAIFEQEIRRKDDGKACVRAICEIVAIVDGVLDMGSVFENFMQNQVPAWLEKYNRKQIK